MRRQGNLAFLRDALKVGVLIVATAAAARATTWNVPGNGSNTCTTVSPNCNTIAQAVTASSNGDTVQIGAGNFATSAAIVLTKTLTIAGAGIGTTFVQPAAGVTAFSVRTSNIVLRDFTIQNGGVGVAFQSAASNNTQITRVSFSGQTSRGIDISIGATFPVTNVSIADSSFATPNIGLRMASASQVTGLTITGTTFTSNVVGIYQANDGNSSRLSGLTIQHSTFTNNTNYGIYAEELRNAVIEDSSFSGGSTGIGLFKFYSSNGVAMSNIAIRRNQFAAIKGNALDFEVYAVGLESPITIESNTIQKNVAISTSIPSVFVSLPPAFTNAAVNIQNNSITASGTFTTGTRVHGIQLRGNGPVVITGNVLDGGNVGGTATTPPSSGILIESRSGTTIMPATVSISASCNRIQGFRNGVSVFDSVNSVYGGLQVGATVSFADNAILGNDSGVVTGAAAPTITAENNYWGCPAGPSDPACDDVVGDVDADPFRTSIPACVSCLQDAECNDGRFCNGAETCGGTGQCIAASDPCVGGLACENRCNEAADDCIVPAGTVCRPAADLCDAVETCTGLGGACPADVPVSAGTGCRPSAGVCDPAESCDGVNNACPNDAKSPEHTGCPSDGNPCSLDECDGVNDACQHPAGNADVECRPSGGVCDPHEVCNGTSTTCPSDAKEPTTTECRASAGVCDPAEFCDGTNSACPADAKAPTTTVCQAAVDLCDATEFCDGTHDTCPADSNKPSTEVCRPAANDCDVAEKCTGSSKQCPANSLKPNGTQCVGSDLNTCMNACITGTCTPATPVTAGACCGNGILDPGEGCDDGNQANGDQCASTCRLELDHFECYRSRVLEPQAPIPPVQLVDQFGTLTEKVGKPTTICNPASKNGEDPGAPAHADHLEGYNITRRFIQQGFQPIRNQKVVNQFGTIFVDVIRPLRLLVPTAQQLVSSPPPLAAPNVDHFTCYTVRRTPGTAALTTHSVTLDDEFGSATVDVGRPTKLCAPTDKNGEDPGAENHLAHLLCYRISRPFTRVGRVFVNNQFGPGLLYPLYRDELCVPSLKNP